MNILSKSVEERGPGITDFEYNTITNKIIEVAKVVGKRPQENASQLLDIIQSKLGNTWGVIVGDYTVNTLGI